MRGRSRRWKLTAFVAPLIIACVAVGVVVALPHQSATPQRFVSNPLPFDLPATSELRSSPHKVFAHYFTPYPLSVDNVPSEKDYYATHYLNPDGEDGKHKAYGGFLRDRPLPQPVSTSKTWELDNYRTEIRRASAAGLDGFTVDMLSVTPGDYNWERLNTLVKAADETDPGFSMVLMPDSTSAAVDDPNALAAAVAELAEHPSVYRLDDGRLVVSPFAPERLGAAWWRNWISIMQTTYKIDVAFVPCFLDYRPNVAAFAPFSYGLSDWGYRNPAANDDLAANIADAHGRNKIWMQPVSAQDERPYASVYDESDNTQNLRLTWDAAIKGADWVQIPTWNDYSEGTQISPSPHTGYGLLDITSYYLTRFKTGQWPQLKRDVVYLSHRVQFAGAPSTESKPMTLRKGSSPARNTVEVLSFLTSSADVTIRIGDAVVTYPAPAGVGARVFALRAGEVAVSVAREGKVVAKVTSPFEVKTDAPIQDLAYRVVSSSR